MPTKRCDDCLEYRAQIGTLRETVAAQAVTENTLTVEVTSLRKSVDQLNRRWSYSTGIIAGVVAAATIIGTLIGIQVNTARLEAEYLKKDAVPIELIIEQLNSEAEASEGYKGD